ncbi:hypothetical protein SFRURICE_008778, partial [Spodoptera frugiperda]
ALLKRQIELSVSLSGSEARRSFQSVASNGEERARNSIGTLLKKNDFYNVSDTLFDHLPIYSVKTNVAILGRVGLQCSGVFMVVSTVDPGLQELQ